MSLIHYLTAVADVSLFSFVNIFYYSFLSQMQISVFRRPLSVT